MNFFKIFMAAALFYAGQNPVFSSETIDDAPQHPHAIHFQIENQYFDYDTYLAIKYETSTQPEYVIELKGVDKFKSFAITIIPTNNMPITSLHLLLYCNYQDAFDPEKTVLKHHYAELNHLVRKIYAIIPAEEGYDFNLDFMYHLSLSNLNQK